MNGRKCTNLAWGIFFILLNFVFALNAFFGNNSKINKFVVYMDGDPNRLLNGMDFRAQMCGLSHLSKKPYLYYASPLVDLNVAFCVNECP